VEAFGPVATVLPYQDTEDAIALARRSAGSLAASVFSADDALASRLVLGAGSLPRTNTGRES